MKTRCHNPSFLFFIFATIFVHHQQIAVAADGTTVSATLKVVSSWNGGNWSHVQLVIKNIGPKAICAAKIQLSTKSGTTIASSWNLDSTGKNGEYNLPSWLNIPAGGQFVDAGFILSGSGLPHVKVLDSQEGGGKKSTNPPAETTIPPGTTIPSSTIPPDEPPKKCVEDQWFHQKLDHFNESCSATFTQRYQANFQFHNKTNSTTNLPIVFLFIGDHTPLDWQMMCADDRNTIFDLAKRHGAILVQLEHRFIERNGSSGLGAMTTSYLQRHLTIDQVLADVASFVPAFNEKYGLKNAQWVAFGDVYSGALAAWLRVQYPNLTIGAVATSAPILAKVDFWEYSAKLDEVIKKTNVQCHRRVKEAYDELAWMVHDEKGQQILDKIYSTDPKFKEMTPIDITNFVWTVHRYSWFNLIQFGGNVTAVCQRMLNATTAQRGLYDVFNDVIQSTSCADQTDCIWSNFTYLDQFQVFQDIAIDGDFAGFRAHFWMGCNELGWFQTSGNGNNTIFGDIITKNFFYQQCTDMFGPKIDATYIDSMVEKTRKKWGDGCTFEATNLIITNGGNDPWSPLSIRKDCRDEKQRKEDAKKHLVYVWTEEGFTSDASWTKFDDEPKGLELTRQIVRDQVKFYLENAMKGSGKQTNV